jgi:release factor glutamine methyltransferase
MTLTPEQMQKVYEIQRGLFQKFREGPLTGQMVLYLGKEFKVYPTVFWPSEDSKALVKNYVVNPNDEVLDVCTGSGVIACYSAWKGASRVVALDINPNAIKSTEENAKRYGLENVVEARLSDVFGAVKPGERFDVVTMNSPLTEHKREVKDVAEVTCWDAELHVATSFFEGLGSVLKPNGRAYITQASFGAIENVRKLAEQNGYTIQEIGKNVVDDLRTFYAFELKRKGEVR